MDVMILGAAFVTTLPLWFALVFQLYDGYAEYVKTRRRR